MDQRKQIGFYYYFDRSWLGGLYYAQNLIIALNTLPDNRKPIINVYCFDEASFLDLKEKTSYPYLKMTIVKINKVKNFVRMLLLPFSWRLASNIDLFEIAPEDEVVFPYGWGKHTKKLLYWMPDLQYKHYPHYFSKRELMKKDFAISAVCRRNIPIVFSSFDSQNDFKRFYPQYAKHKTHVVHFAVSQSDFSDKDIEEVKQKYGITGEFFMCANQFWQHKNHLFLFRAFKKAIDQGLTIQLVCTGRLADNRNPNYIESIKSYLKTSGLSDQVKLLGIIDKEDMLCLMRNSYAVVQPSLFEGWNTTVEDCKKMNKFIFLSDLPVHREQIKENVCFFNPKDEDDLANKLLNVTPTEMNLGYNQYVNAFAEDFISIVEAITNSNKLYE